MATAPTIYQKKLAARRATADIERLAKTYQSGLFDVTQQQQTAFTGWQEKTKQAMAPYEADVEKYTKVDFPAYQSSLAGYQSTMDAYKAQADAYRQRLDAFNKSILDIEANPNEVVNAPSTWTRSYNIYTIDGKQYPENALPPGYFIDYSKTKVETTTRGRPVTVTKDVKQLMRSRSIPTFTEEPPAAPSVEMPRAPTPPGAPPTLPELDTSEFAQKREQLGKTFQREVGERKAAKQNVVMRRLGRSMLQGE